MNTDPQRISAQVDAVLADLPPVESGDSGDSGDSVDSGDRDDAAEAAMIDAHARRLEEAHQILVDALESVEKG
ncbi:MAG: hypothetical protein WBC17_16715 [Mycobacterium sp.]